MVFLTKKRKGNKDYYYLMETGWVNGRSRIVWQKYLGTAESILRKLQGPEIQDVYSFGVGRLAAVLAADRDLGFADSVNRHVKKRKVQGLTVGQYLLLFIAGRSEKPVSKRGLEGWFNDSYLRRLWAARQKVNEQNFWNQMVRITDEVMEKVTDDITLKLVQKGLRPSRLIFDTTNFWTNIEKGEELPKAGRSKEGRCDKKLLGVGMAVSEENVPFFGEAYRGNENDSKVFLRVVDKLTARLKRLRILPEEKLVLVFDRGCNSEDGVKEALSTMHVIGGLKRNQASELLDVPLEKFNPLYETSKGNVILGYCTEKVVFGRPFRVIIAYNPATAEEERARYFKDKAEFLEVVERVKASFSRKGRGRRLSKKGAADRLEKYASRHKGVLCFDVCQLGLDMNHVVGWIDEAQERRLLASFGKQLIFTDMKGEAAEVVKVYNSKHLIEEDFKFLKDKLIIPIKPVYHRLDKTIKVHVWLCLMALLFFRYTIWKTKKYGLSVKELITALDRIRVAAVKQEGRGVKYMLERLDKDALALVQDLGIGSILKL